MCSPKVDLGWWGGSGGIRDGRQVWFKLKRGHIETISYSGGNSSALAAANCDPDYGWINGPEGSNKCYMYLKVQPDFSVIAFFLETSYSLLYSLKSVQLAKFFETRTPPIQRAFRTAEVDILTTAVTRQEFDCFSKITGNYYFCDPARFSFSFWKFLRSIAGKSQLLHWLLRLLLLPGTSREDIKPYMYTMYMTSVL